MSITNRILIFLNIVTHFVLLFIILTVLMIIKILLHYASVMKQIKKYLE